MEPVQIFKNMFNSRKVATAANSTVVIVKPDTDPPPQIALSDVETRLNMHQHNGLFDTSSSDRTNGVKPESSSGKLPFFLCCAHRESYSACCTHEYISLSLASAEADVVAFTLFFCADDNTRPSSPPTTTNGDSSNSEWSSAIGHAMTGKSGRVIHNLQEDIARLTRECNLYRCRAEEAQRANELLKQQLQNTTDRLRNSEQSHEANLNSIARKDRKIEDLKAEIQSEKDRRMRAQEDARRTDQLAAEERDEHQRAFAEAHELAQRSRCQYEALSQTRVKDRNEFESRFDLFRKEMDELHERETQRRNNLSRLDVIIEQKNREIEASKDRMEQFGTLFQEYKEDNDKIIRDLVEKSQKNDTMIDGALKEAGKVTDKMKWVMNIRDEFGDSEESSKPASS